MTMTAYTIRFRKSPRSAAVLTWTRFAESMGDATASARRALGEEYFGKAVLLEVVR